MILQGFRVVTLKLCQQDKITQRAFEEQETQTRCFFYRAHYVLQVRQKSQVSLYSLHKAHTRTRN